MKTAPIALVLLIITSSESGQGAQPLPTAIRNARIVTVSGPTIEHGTIVLRGGLIEAVGASITIPADATVIDGTDSTVYPGLIDLGSTVATDALPATQPLQGTQTTARVEQWKRLQLLRPQARAADLVKVDDAALTRWAAIGVTTMLAMPPGDVVHGQSALVSTWMPPEAPQIGNIATSRRAAAILRSPVALHVSLPARPRIGTSAYPVSLMGVIAFVRQAFLDAQHFGLQQTRNTAPDDPLLAAMQPALARRMPVVFEANETREIMRAVGLAREFGLDPIIIGGREAHTASAELKASSAAVVVSLNYPQRSRALAPDDDEPLRVVEARAEAPASAASLSKAGGIRFGFASNGLTEVNDFRRNLGKAVAAGLQEDAAIRALTLDAATLAGVSDRLGSLEPRKLANLVVAEGNLLDEKTVIKHVFIAGHPVPLDRR